MDLFMRAKTIRLIGHRDRYLVASDDCTTVTLGRDPSAENAIWAIEFVMDRDYIRLQSCFDTYLTASSVPILPGVTARRVVQARACQSCDPAGPDKWEPYRDGMQVRLRSLWGNFLRPKGGLPPWRNTVTHDVPGRGRTREKMLWEVEVVERCPARRGPLLLCRLRSVVAGTMEGQRRGLLKDGQVEQRGFGSKCCWYPMVRVGLSR